MSYSPGFREPVLTMVASDGPWSLAYGMTASAAASAAFESANRGVWFPLSIPTACSARRMWWANGGTVSASYNVEAGLYLDAGYKPGAKLITTGSVAQGTATAIQFADITDTALAPGLIWLFMSCSSSSATFLRSTIAAANIDELLRFQQASIGPGSAPSTATPVESGGTQTYVFGFATTASP